MILQCDFLPSNISVGKKTLYRYHMINLISACDNFFRYFRPNLQQSFGTPQQTINPG